MAKKSQKPIVKINDDELDKERELKAFGEKDPEKEVLDGGVGADTELSEEVLDAVAEEDFSPDMDDDETEDW